MDILDVKIIKDYIRMCDDGWQQGWHERNAGNLTYRMREDEVADCREYFVLDRPWVDMGVTGKNLAGEYFITTGAGKYFRNTVLDPENCIGIVEINHAGDGYRIVWGLSNGGRPTSEFPSHFLNHSVKKEATKGENRVIYHAHPPAVIALTFVLPLTEKAFNDALWRTITECPIVFPVGVGVVGWMMPGGVEVAKVTSELMKKRDAVIWAHHGMFVSGADFDLAFGLMHTVEKSADIVGRVFSMGKPVLQSISDDELRAVAVDFKLDNFNAALLEE